MLNSLFLDKVNHDLRQLRTINALLTLGEKVCGPGFIDRMNDEILSGDSPEKRGFKKVEELALFPSQDLGELASRFVKKARFLTFDLGLIHRFLFKIADMDIETEADLVSYLLFHPSYINELLELGREDARAREEELLSFFG
jgi:NTE family protein